MLPTTPTVDLLARAIEVSALRQSVHASNIANVNVEGYRRMDVSFDGTLERIALEIARARPDHLAATAFETNSAQVYATSETVKLDEEMGRMAKNALVYQTLLGAYEKSLGLLRMAIKEGRE